MQLKNTHSQWELFGRELAEILNHQHLLYILANKNDWSQFEQEIDPCYIPDEMGLMFNSSTAVHTKTPAFTVRTPIASTFLQSKM